MPKIITLAHQKGGVGKSTLALNLAYVFNSSLNVGLLDADLQGSLSSLPLMADGITIISLPKDMEELRKLEFDVIIIDTPPYLSNNLPKLFNVSDFILVPTKAGFLDVMAIQSTIALIQQAKKANPCLKAGIVFNMIQSRYSTVCQVKKMLKDSAVPLLTSFISQRVSYVRSVITSGIINSNDEKAKEEILALAEEILEKLGL